MKKLQIGDKATTKRTFSHADLGEYASLAGIVVSGNLGIVPGPLLGGMFSYLLGTQCPGRGTNYLKQHLEFPIPARVGEELTATVEIIRLRPEKELANLRTVCTNAAGQIVCQGEALVLVKDVE
jgi:3-hydroxybutyryl-CoA dehydratase